MTTLATLTKTIANKKYEQELAEKEEVLYTYEATLNEHEERNPLAVAAARTQGLRFVKVYQPFVDALGYQDGYFLSVLMNRYLFHVKYNNLTNESWYFLKLDTLNSITKMGEKAQNTRIKSLENKGLVETTNMGVGNKRYVKLNTVMMVEMLTNEGYVAVLRNHEKDKNKAKASHLPAGPKPKKSELINQVVAVDNGDNSNLDFLQVGENYFLQVGENTFSNSENELSPVSSNILYPTNKPSEKRTTKNYIEYPSNPSINSSIENEGIVDKTSIQLKFEKDIAIKRQLDAERKAMFDRILVSVRLIQDKFINFPKNLVPFLESRVSKAYETNKPAYDMFNEHYYVIPNLYDKYKSQINDDGFMRALNDFFFNSESKIFSMKAYIEKRIKLYLGLEESKFDKPIVKPQFKKMHFTYDQIMQFKRAYNSLDLAFPWEYFNEIFSSQLTPEEIAERKNSWLNIRQMRYSQAN